MLSFTFLRVLFTVHSVCFVFGHLRSFLFHRFVRKKNHVVTLTKNNMKTTVCGFHPLFVGSSLWILGKPFGREQTRQRQARREKKMKHEHETVTARDSCEFLDLVRLVHFPNGLSEMSCSPLKVPESNASSSSSDPLSSNSVQSVSQSAFS